MNKVQKKRLESPVEHTVQYRWVSQRITQGVMLCCLKLEHVPQCNIFRNMSVWTTFLQSCPPYWRIRSLSPLPKAPANLVCYLIVSRTASKKCYTLATLCRARKNKI